MKLDHLNIKTSLFEELAEVSTHELMYGFTSEEIKDKTEEQIKYIKSRTLEYVLQELNQKYSNGVCISEQIKGHLSIALFLFVFLYSILWLLERFLSFRLEGFSVFLFLALTASFSFFCASSAIHEDLDKGRLKIQRLTSLMRTRKIYQECQKFNKIVKAISAKGKIAEIQGREELIVKEEFLDLLRKMRDNLIKSIKIDRVVRENSEVLDPDVLSSLQEVFCEFQSMDTFETASQYSDSIDELIEIGSQLNKEFVSLAQSRFE